MSDQIPCGRCGEIKHKDMFHKNRSRDRGYSSYCKECRKARYQTDKGGVRAKRLERVYGIASGVYSLMLSGQNNACAICENPQGTLRRRP